MWSTHVTRSPFHRIGDMKLLLLILASAAAFSPSCAPRAAHSRARAPVCVEASSRRQAVLAGAGLLAAVALPALAEENEEAMARIAEKNRLALLKEKEEKKEKIMSRIKEEENPGEKVKKIASVAVGGVLLSVPFYYRNLARLFTKITSGGKDDGYATKSKAGGIDAAKAAQAAKRAFLGK
ncbi:hypothetical protein AB1Y20_004426 [Prymnesium parvum]|uniref:PS II complex 12 kDa extrinsic protein n=1 Tax=Prymnesium parvum TaxID=97485 RepID=A0AB34IW75_PRYPA